MLSRKRKQNHDKRDMWLFFSFLYSFNWLVVRFEIKDQRSCSMSLSNNLFTLIQRFNFKSTPSAFSVVSKYNVHLSDPPASVCHFYRKFGLTGCVTCQAAGCYGGQSRQTLAGGRQENRTGVFVCFGSSSSPDRWLFCTILPPQPRPRHITKLEKVQKQQNK